MKRALLWAAGLVMLITAAFGGYLTYLGFFASDPYKVIAAAPGHPAPGYAVAFLSGDMGFNAGMGPQLAERFAADGVPVLGFNSLTFFRQRRTRRQVEAMVRETTARTMATFGVTRVVLLGQSFGADALQLGLPAMPPAMRRHVAFVALMVPTDTIFLQATPDEMFNWSPPDLPAVPTGRLLDWVPGLCVHGAAETHSLCPALTQPNLERIALPGRALSEQGSDTAYRVLKQAIASRARGL